jgi:hypothetical protein
MKSKNLNELLEKIDSLHKTYIATRGIIQYINEDKIGKSELKWGSNINSEWVDIQFNFKQQISIEIRNELNRISESINQNFIIRLHSLLDYEGIKNGKSLIDKSIEGFEMIEIIHFLRKQFAHRHGNFDLNDIDSIKTRERLFKDFNIEHYESLPNQFPLDKNRVILPIVNGTKKYVSGYWNKHEK